MSQDLLGSWTSGKKIDQLKKNWMRHDSPTQREFFLRGRCIQELGEEFQQPIAQGIEPDR